MVFPNAGTLILGSMPSVTSLAQQEYYAYPRNAFWDIIEYVYGIPRRLDYAQRTQQLCQLGVALWDVLRQCERSGSGDASITKEVANDFNDFFDRHERISSVFFNGRKAEQVWRKYILANLDERRQVLPTVCLPSTSPAFAQQSVQQKARVWKIALLKKDGMLAC